MVTPAKLAGGSDAAYLALATALIDEQIESADASERGLTLRHQGEPCRLAATRTGSDAIRVLYWTAVRRMQSHTTGSSWTVHPSISAVDNTLTRTRISLPQCSTSEEHGYRELLPPPTLCRYCENLHLDLHYATGHDELHPISGRYFRSIGMGTLSEAQTYECRVCKTTWTQHKNRANPFSTWTMRRQSSSWPLQAVDT